MADLLSSEQVILLNNLMYLDGGVFTSVTDSAGMTVKDYVAQQLNSLSNVVGPLSEQQQRYQSILKAVQNDSSLNSMVIAAAKVESAADGKGGSAMFVNEGSKEAVVAYRGTGKEEWKDNFIGGGKTDAADGVSTPYQEAALRTYQEYTGQLNGDYTITVTGHSKGGNKAKYITVMDDSVDRCISCDGQGFSDDFMKAYADQISRNQDKITNHNVDDDFVNLLLNDIGETVYYKNNKGKSDLTYNHYCDAYFKLDADGNYSVNVTNRPPEVAQLDAFLNSLLRSMPPERREETLAFIGDIASTARHDGMSVENILTLLLSGSNVDNTAYVLAFLVRYEQEHPEFADAIAAYLERNGLGKFNSVIMTLKECLNSDWFQWIVDHQWLLDKGIKVLWAVMPGFLKDKILDFLNEKFGLTLTEGQLFALLMGLVDSVGYMNEIEEIPDGSDMRVSAFNDRIYVDTDYLDELASALKNLGGELSQLSARARSIAADSAMDNLRFQVPFFFRSWIRRITGGTGSMVVAALTRMLGQALSGSSEYAEALGQAVSRVSETFEDAENDVAGHDDF